MSSPKHPPSSHRNAGSSSAATPSAAPSTLRRAAAPASTVRLNKRLATLQARGLIRIEYGGLRVLSLSGLRSGEF